MTHRHKILWHTFWTCLRFLKSERQIIMQQETMQRRQLQTQTGGQMVLDQLCSPEENVLSCHELLKLKT